MPTRPSGRRRPARALPVLLAAALLVATVGAVAAAPRPAAAASSPSAGLRVATFNTYLLSPAMRCLRHLVDPESVASMPVDFFTCLDSDVVERRAATLAAELVAAADDYDVLALNEVWDEDARRILVEALEPLFPHHVDKIDLPLVQTTAHPIPGTEQDEFRFNFEDSGLMLFAKPFLEPEDLPRLPPGGVPLYIGSGHDVLPLPPTGLLPISTVEGTIPQVAFTAFGNACAIDDCLAAKGAGLVRFHDRRNEDKVNVAFTHMQAEVAHDGVRERQLDAIRNLLVRSLDLSTTLPYEQLYVMGDLNVKGEGQVNADPWTPQGTGEWGARFGDPGSFFDSALHEAWALTTSEQDRGVTHVASGERLDHILTNRLVPGHLGWDWNSIDGGRCVQHLTVELSGTPSDHSMVRADTNRAWHYCNPRAAWTKPPIDVFLQDNPAVGPWDTTELRYEGSMQWLHVVDPTNAAYEIGYMEGTRPIRVDVYAPDDLTTPIAPYREKEVEKRIDDQRPFISKQYVLPPEFYVRITAAKPGDTGDIAPIVHRMRCDSVDEACPLDVAAPQVARFPATAPLGADDTAWFQLDVTQTADSGVAQQVQVVADQLDPDRFRIDVVDAADPWGGSPYPASPTPAGDGVVHDLAVGAPGRYYLRITRGGPDGVPAEVRAGWTTNLQVAELTTLRCIDETNGFLGSESGSDEINLDLGVDGFQRWGTGSVGSWWSFDCDDSTDEQQLGPITVRFLDDLAVQVWEIDDASPNDASGTLSFAAEGRLLDRHEVREGATLRWHFEGGEYTLAVDLRRRPNEPVL